MKDIYQECVEIIRELVGNEYLYFDSAVEVKITPHSIPFLAWAVAVSPKDENFIMDNNQEWHMLQIEDMNAGLMIGSLNQRLKMMRITLAKAS